MRIVKLNKKEATGPISEEGVAITPFARGPGLRRGRIIKHGGFSCGMNDRIFENQEMKGTR
jgi:hypothetical protein